MRKPGSVEALTNLGRERLSSSFFLRDFLHSEIAEIHGIANVPDDPELAIAAGTRLCEDLLEPLQARFGRIAIRSAYRSSAVNELGNRMQAEGRRGYNCAANAANHARHIWDRRDADACMGAVACIVIPGIWDRFGAEPDGWKRLAWWIHDHLPYAEMEFFPRYWAFNIGWHERPVRSIYARIPPDTGYLTRKGMPGWDGSHEAAWAPLAA